MRSEIEILDRIDKWETVKFGKYSANDIATIIQELRWVLGRDGLPFEEIIREK